VNPRLGQICAANCARTVAALLIGDARLVEVPFSHAPVLARTIPVDAHVCDGLRMDPIARERSRNHFQAPECKHPHPEIAVRREPKSRVPSADRVENSLPE